MIHVRNIYKRFKRYSRPSDRLKEIVFRKKYHRDFYALKDISFEVEPGQTIGIIGQNGAGKSTLLKILTGVLLPDRGQIHVDGKITGLLELGTGFNYELSGLRNIQMNAMLLGMRNSEIAAKLEQIVDFSELGNFINEPIKTYSSGMVMRLAFSVAIFADPKAFVVDEALSVGDAHFQQKCISKIKAFKKNGGAIVFVSHDMNAVKVLCDNAVLMEKGEIVERGTPQKVVNEYNCFIAKLHDKEGKILDVREVDPDYGTMEAVIREVTIEGKYSRSNMISAGEPATIKVVIDSYVDMGDINVGILIRDKFGQSIYGTTLSALNGKKISLKKDKTYKLIYELDLDLGVGKYTITSAIHTDIHHLDHCLHWVDNFETFEVSGYFDNIFEGICKLKPSVTVHESAPKKSP